MSRTGRGERLPLWGVLEAIVAKAAVRSAGEPIRMGRYSHVLLVLNSGRLAAGRVEITLTASLR